LLPALTWFSSWWSFVENECPVIVSSVLHHLMNCDLVREEGGEKKQEEGEGKE